MVILLSDPIKLNQIICSKPFPIPKIQDILIKIQGFTNCSSLSINMVYYHIELSPGAKKNKINKKYL